MIEALQSVLHPYETPIALHEPCFRGGELAYVGECISSGWVSSVGSFVDRFESDLATFTGVRRAIAVVNGTAALHICLKLVGVEAGDEVLVPTLTFIATANAVAYLGATPHFVDSSFQTLGLDPEKLEEYLSEIAEVRENRCFNKVTGRRLAAVVPMHTFGHPVDLDALVRLCELFKIPLVEDAAESLGSYFKGQHTGNLGRVSALSFNGNKVITTGGGGAILTNDESLGNMAKHLTTTARVPHSWELSHDMIGYNYRMPNINAALGCAQLEQLPMFLRQKRALAERYEAALSSVDGISFVKEPIHSRSNYWLNAVLLDEDFASHRDSLLQATNGRGIQTRPAWTLMHRLPMFSSSPRMDLAVAESIASRLINIPSSAFLGGS